MSRKSRQKKGRQLLNKLPSTGILIFMLIAGLWLGAIFSIAPLSSKPPLLEDTIPLTATMQKVEGNYRRRYVGGFKLKEIDLYFGDPDSFLYLPDLERLQIDSIIANETLLKKLEAYPAGTVFDMRLKPNSINVMTLSVDGMDILTYEAACRAIRVNNIMGLGLGLFMLFIAGYAAWGLFITWKYRKLA